MTDEGERDVRSPIPMRSMVSTDCCPSCISSTLTEESESDANFSLFRRLSLFQDDLKWLETTPTRCSVNHQLTKCSYGTMLEISYLSGRMI
jgi:hypothetical protein